MASWLLPALKAILPHVGMIVDAAKPVFTRKQPESGTDVQQQIAELQAAASQNAEYVKELAEQLQSTVAALEQSASIAESRLRRATVSASISVAVSVAALLLALVSYLRL
jgi:lipopolysaccharide biosynthesis regulator YciM